QAGEERGPEMLVGLAALSGEQRLVVDVVLGEESVLQVRVVGVDHLDVEVGELVFACGHDSLPIVVGIATASTAGWIQAAVRRGERASPGWCDRGRVRGRAAKRGGRRGGPTGTGARARPARARLPGAQRGGTKQAGDRHHGPFGPSRTPTVPNGQWQAVPVRVIARPAALRGSSPGPAGPVPQ